jgi:N-ethylmaleimide reductase
LAEFRPLFKGVIIGNCGYTRETAEERIAEGNADIVAIGRPFITNPDLPERYGNNWPLNPADDMSLWYTTGPEGYTDYTPYKP